MTLVLNLSADLEARLAEKAHAEGKDVVTYVNDLIRKNLDCGTGLTSTLKPVHETSQLKDLSDEEFDHFIDEVRAEVHRERKGG